MYTTTNTFESGYQQNEKKEKLDLSPCQGGKPATEK